MKDLAILEEKEVAYKVTSLTPLKGEMFKVLLNDEIELILNESSIVKYRLLKGKELSEEEYCDIISTKQFFEAYSKALKYANSYFKPSYEIYLYLIKKGYDDTISKNVCELLIKNHILDDLKFKELYVSKLIRDGYGKNMISYKLREKKLEDDFLVDEEMYNNALSKIINLKLKSLKDNKKERLYKYLIQRGYTKDDILNALKGVSFE